ncbi:4-oxalocrotonate tautomerase [Acidovorax sp. D2M1]|uniref:Tautomerase n=2 Tax=Acidovorax TaxID=12916 RepID=A0ABT5RYI5_9BURK|nr:4-oxalocrotonate tautomerase [Acidovorax benzenivorans]MDD2178740.1 4-oxalocrotonate tautomerase [Acidovorax benzenivorans]
MRSNPPPRAVRLRRYDLRFSLNSQRAKEQDMPTYHIEMMEGRTVEQKKKLVEEITRVSVEILGGSPESVDILITDIKRENWATGGKLWLERTS